MLRLLGLVVSLPLHCGLTSLQKQRAMTRWEYRDIPRLQAEMGQHTLLYILAFESWQPAVIDGTTNQTLSSPCQAFTIPLATVQLEAELPWRWPRSGYCLHELDMNRHMMLHVVKRICNNGACWTWSMFDIASGDGQFVRYFRRCTLKPPCRVHLQP